MVVALEAKLLLRTSKQGGGSGAWHQDLKRTVAPPGRAEHGVGITSGSLVPSACWGIGFPVGVARKVLRLRLSKTLNKKLES